MTNCLETESQLSKSSRRRWKYDGSEIDSGTVKFPLCIEPYGSRVCELQSVV